MTPRKILTICASLRKSSFNGVLLEAAEDELKRLGHHTTRFGGLTGLPHYNEDLDRDPPRVIEDARAAIGSAHAVLIASPTYNDGIPGGLKDLIDWASRPPGNSVLINKPVGIITASVGPGAGQASAQYIDRVVTLLKGKVVQPITSIGKVTHSVSDRGIPDDPTRARVVETAQALALAAQGAELTNDRAAKRYELRLNGDVAGFAEYIEHPNGSSMSVELPHTVTEPAFRGQGVASVLVRGVLEKITRDGHDVIPTCTFVAAFIAKQSGR